ncbi:hypothetical protein [Polyangium mundeleinium]|uniref:DUF4105 domain-containing protein n=1 Tax=Polyangium mundeleinium TaxID=2995306 RepID=A0ABT5EFU2_9BACT|nr:hypothetical protein [Polyangium mundeleinium]MDC0740690.1 hypothetical protein [Polyangium mundeleinium]
MSRKAAHSGKIIGVRLTAKDKYGNMVAYALKHLKENDNPKRKPYAIRSHNCYTFALDVARQSGTDLSAGDALFPKSGMDGLRKIYENVNYPE